MVGFKFVNKTLNDEYTKYFHIKSRNIKRNYYKSGYDFQSEFLDDVSEPCTINHFKGVDKD